MRNKKEIEDIKQEIRERERAWPYFAVLGSGLVFFGASTINNLIVGRLTLYPSILNVLQLLGAGAAFIIVGSHKNKLGVLREQERVLSETGKKEGGFQHRIGKKP